VRACQLRFTKYVPLLMNTFCICMLFFVRLEMEPGWLRVMRSVGFSVLCVVWVYVVGVWQRCGASNQHLFTQNILVRFCPVLFVYPVMSLLYFMLCVVALVCLYVDIHAGGLRFCLLSGYAQAGFAAPGAAQGFAQRPRDEDGCGDDAGTMLDDAELLRSCSAARGGLGSGGAVDDFSAVSGTMHLNAIEEDDNEEDLEACFRTAYQERRSGYAP